MNTPDKNSWLPESSTSLFIYLGQLESATCLLYILFIVSYILFNTMLLQSYYYSVVDRVPDSYSIAGFEIKIAYSQTRNMQVENRMLVTFVQAFSES